MFICPNKSFRSDPNQLKSDWQMLVDRHGETKAYQEYVKNGFEIPSVAKSLYSLKAEDPYVKIETLDKVVTFLDNINIPIEFTDFGDTPALAAANFEKGVLQITNDLKDYVPPED